MYNKLFVLYTNKTRPSGKALANKLEAMSKNISVSNGLLKDFISVSTLEKPPDVVINVGHANNIPQFNGLILNKPICISHSSNKLRARKTFVENDIPCPTL